MAKTLCLSQNADADALLTRDPLALLIGMVLDQQIPLEKAFSSPYVLTERLGHDLDAREIAEYEPEAFAKVFATPPALHRFPGSMAGRVQELCRVLVEEYGGDPRGRTPSCLPSSATKILAFCSPKPGSALTLLSSSSPVLAPFQTLAASPS